MKVKTLSIAVLATAALVSTIQAQPSEPSNDAAERVDEAALVLNEIMNAPDERIPQDLLADARCVAIVPGLKQGAFIVGGEYGKGAMLCREPDGDGWTAPSMIRVEGGSIGLQIGGSETDLILLVMNKQGADELMSSEFTLGVDATVAAGPVGRDASAETDAYMQAKILAYSRSRGVFAGVSLEGSTLRSDKGANELLYGRLVAHTDILHGKVAAPAAATELISSLNRFSPVEGS